MDKKSKNTIIISIVALAIVLITVTYAYFSARITGIESASTISLTAGTMGIHYTEGNENVILTNIYPRETVWVTKTFTLTGNNTTNLTMYYNIGLNVTTNTFPDNYLTYDLTLVSSTNGTPIGAKTNQPINGTGKIKFGKGTFTNATNDTHNYELKIYFKDNGELQNDAQEAVLNAKIYVEEAFEDAPEGWRYPATGTLLAGIKSTGGTIHNDSDTGMAAPGRAYATTNEGLRSTTDDYGTSYYYRGAVENNYVVFAGMCWRIVRVDGAGNTKIVLYNYNPNDVTNPCATSEDGNGRAFIGASSFNQSYNKNTYVGYMYSNNPDSNDFDTAHANDNDSTILTFLKDWYDEKLRSYNDMLADVIWCNDKSIVTDTTYDPWNWGNIQGTGLGTDVTYYKSTYRLNPVNTAAPSLVCPTAGSNGKLSKFTARDTVNGNAKLYSDNKEYKIGLLTADEIAFAGNKFEKDYGNTSYYLYNNSINDTGEWYWSLSPSGFYGGSADVWGVNYRGGDGVGVADYGAVRPAVSLKSTVSIASGGAGTSSNPFVIENTEMLIPPDPPEEDDYEPYH